MLIIILNIIGLICIIISLILIKKNFNKEMGMYEEILLIYDNIKDYSNTIDNTLSNFDVLMETSLKKMEVLEKNNMIGKSIEDSYLLNKHAKIILEESDENATMSTGNSYNKIMELKKIGLSNEEIAKNLDMGIREVEIILKMWNNR